MNSTEVMESLRTPEGVAENNYWLVYDGMRGKPIPPVEYAQYFAMGEIPIAVPGDSMHGHDSLHRDNYSVLFANKDFADITRNAATESRLSGQEALFTLVLDDLADSLYYFDTSTADQEAWLKAMLHRVNTLICLSTRADNPIHNFQNILRTRSVLSGIGFDALPGATDEELIAAMEIEAKTLNEYLDVLAIMRKHGRFSPEGRAAEIAMNEAYNAKITAQSQ